MTRYVKGVTQFYTKYITLLLSNPLYSYEVTCFSGQRTLPVFCRFCLLARQTFLGLNVSRDTGSRRRVRAQALACRCAMASRTFTM